jgi:hypothetical protein
VWHLDENYGKISVREVRTPKKSKTAVGNAGEPLLDVRD